MRKKYLTFFSNAMMEVFKEIGFEKIEVNDIEMSQLQSEIVASVGITGDLQGYLILQSNLDSAYKFVSKMLANMNMEAEEDNFGQFHKEAIGEIVNQVSGRSIMMLADDNIDCNITPPTIITGKNIYSDVNSLETILSISIIGSFGTVGLFVGLKNIK